ncbi:MAG: hypothetical protein U0804_16025 [Gemmataceae bacterium]
MNRDCSALIAEATELGVLITIDADRLTVTGPAVAAALGRELVERKAEVLAHLAKLSRWDTAGAVRLMEAADAAVDQNGCRGADPAIQAAVGRACEAYQRHDLAALTLACDEVAALARSLKVSA